ncbi:hypothetical protein ACFOY2_05445 [Nonomuraea purpurea]|uniref:Uncharacterized protein n=1 Tax=Nonomuraea purpurea TaxID=1849276 RepID=A0ABV8G0B6_9ACTN
MPDLYPNDLTVRIRQLERDVEELKALLRARQPTTAASQGWLLSNMSIPSVSAGTCHIGCTGGDVFSVNAAGKIKRMFEQAPAIDNQANFISGDIGGTPNATQYNNLRADAVATRAYVFSVVTLLRGAGFINT